MVCPPASQNENEEIFQVESAITGFLADPLRSSLELPHMTTGERKQAKKLADSYTELRCESYGFGQERRLHLFKSAGDSSAKTVTTASVPKDHAAVLAEPSTVRVKNTFIEGWAASEGADDGAEPVMFRSMPPRQLSEDKLDLSGHMDLTPISKASPRTESGTTSPDRSTCASGTSPLSQASTPVHMVFSPEGLPPMQVRNTFIHIEGMSADERVVQSMPHNMFAKCLWAESQALAAESAGTADALTAVAPDYGAVPDSLQFVPGVEVVIEGLTKAPAFNGLHAVVQYLDAETGRYSVLLVANGKMAKIKGENLRLVEPPALCFESSCESFEKLMSNGCEFFGTSSPSAPSSPTAPR